MRNFVIPLIHEAGKIAANFYDKGIAYKKKSSIADLVTVADTTVNNYLVKNILKKFPEHHILSEELDTEINSGHEYQWIIDPIDGTRNFVHGITSWCVMLALLHNEKPILNAVYQPITGELYCAELGKGCWKNDKKITVNQTASLKHALGIICCDASGAEVTRFRRAVHHFLENAGWLHNHGSMLSACHLAAGGIDFLVNNYGYTHDYLPIVLICEEAGAIVTDSRGEPWNRGKRDIVICNKKIHGSVVELFG